MNTTTNFNSLAELAEHLRKDLTGDHRKEKDLILLFAHNGTGKTRLSRAFGKAGKKFDEEGNEKNRFSHRGKSLEKLLDFLARCE